VRRYKRLVAKLLERANLQSASALYVPLQHFPSKTAAFRSLPPRACDPESAAFGCNKSTNKDEQGRLSTTDAPPIRGSALFVAIRPLSWLFAFTRTESFLCACNLVCGSVILLVQYAFQIVNILPELVELVEALTLGRGLFQFKVGFSKRCAPSCMLQKRAN
jgi:hypothetical protein